MQTISADAQNILLAGGLTTISISCSGLDGALTITSPDIVGGTFLLDRNCISGDNIEIGNTETAELSFVLDNFDRRFDTYRFEGAILTPTVTIGVQTVTLGKFIVDEIPAKTSKLQIKALDYMAKLNKRCTTASFGGDTLENLLGVIATACSFTRYTLTFTNGSIVAPSITNAAEYTYHELLSFICELACCNAWFDWNGELRLTWYGESQGATVITNTAQNRYSYEMDENEVQITGVVYVSDSGAETLVGTKDYALVIDANPLVSSYDVTAVVTNIYNKCAGLTYKAFNFTSTACPHLWPMDELTITDNKSATVISYVMNMQYKFNGLSKIAAKGSSVIKTGYASAGVFTQRQKVIIQSLVSEPPSLTNLEQAIIQMNDLAANAKGFYMTIDGDPITEAVIIYEHDAPLLADSMVIYKRTEAGFFWTDTGWNGGSPVWTSGYTASGNIVAKTLSVVGINADWITAGSVSSENYAYTSGEFSDTGTKINLSDGSIRSKSFAIDSLGNGHFVGKISAESGSIAGWTVSPSAIYSGDLFLYSSGQIICSPDLSEYSFSVNTLGKLTAKGCQFYTIDVGLGATFGGDVVFGSGTVKIGGSVHYCTIGSSGNISTNQTLRVGGTSSYLQISSSGGISQIGSGTASFADGNFTVNSLGAIVVKGSATFGSAGACVINTLGAITTSSTITCESTLRVGDLTDYLTVNSIGNLVTTGTITCGGSATFNGITNTIANALKHTGSTLGFFNKTPTTAKTVLAPSAVTATGTADTTYSSNEVTLINALKTDVTNLRTKLNEIWTALDAYGLA